MASGTSSHWWRPGSQGKGGIVENWRSWRPTSWTSSGSLAGAGSGNSVCKRGVGPLATHQAPRGHGAVKVVLWMKDRSRRKLVPAYAARTRFTRRPNACRWPRRRGHMMPSCALLSSHRPHGAHPTLARVPEPKNRVEQVGHMFARCPLDPARPTHGGSGGIGRGPVARCPVISWRARWWTCRRC